MMMQDWQLFSVILLVLIVFALTEIEMRRTK